MTVAVFPSVAKCRAKEPASCPYHGALIEMAIAKAHLQFDDYADAKRRLEDAVATNDFARQEKAIEEGAPVANIEDYLARREQASEALKKEEAQAANPAPKATRKPRAAKTAAPKSTIDFPKKHTFDVPTYTVINQGYQTATVGSKVARSGEYVKTSVYASRVRQDLKEAQAKGYLPKNLKFSVNTDTYSMGSAIIVGIQGVSDKDHYENGDTYDYGVSRRSAKAKELLQRVEWIVNAYSSQTRDNLGDGGGHSTYWSRISIEDEAGKASRLKEVAAKKEIAKGKADAKQLVQSFRANGPSFLLSKGLRLTDKTTDGREFGRIPGTKFIAVANNNPIAPTGKTYELFNFSGFDESRGSIEQTLSELSYLRLQYRFGRKRRML